MSGMPGPLSRATIWMPARPLSRARHGASWISPCFAYSTMLRESSEMAVAMQIWSVAEKPSFAAIARPLCRAATMSWSDTIGIKTPSSMRLVRPRKPVQEVKRFLQVQGGPDIGQAQAELDHREGHLGLDADDHRLRAAHLQDLADAAERAHGERVHDVEHRDVD